MDASPRPDQKTPQAVQFLQDAVAYYDKLGVCIKRLRTDKGSAFRSHDNGHRPHGDFGVAAPMSRLSVSGDKLSTVHITKAASHCLRQTTLPASRTR